MSFDKKPFRMLSIDGGGIRGIYVAHILKRIEEEFSVNFIDTFDLITGTSTGSIIAASLALGLQASKITEFYEKDGKEVFSPSKISLNGLVGSKYKKDHLRKILGDIFGDATLSDVKTRLLIPATDISNGTVHVFKSPYLESFVRDRNIKITEAVLASCSAPTYFNPELVKEYLLSDGGLWANNPALVGFVEAIGKLGVPAEQVHILSIGTGISEKYYPVSKHDKPWGVLGWNIPKLIGMIFNLQSSSAANMIGLMLPSSRYLRINFSSDKTLSLDDHGSVLDLKSRADLALTHNSEQIKKLLNIK